jgi:peptidoglycan hydrolase-like protein with peptidoglycan-binding domain
VSDPWVAITQEWLNETYTGVPGWNPVVQDGVTGWQTMHALTRALQHELGLTSLADNFGPGTMAALTNFGNITEATSQTKPNIVKILIGGLYCKGYNGANGIIPDQWSGQTTIGVSTIQDDMGLTQTGVVAPKLFKAILNMDAYVVVGSGQGFVRTVQRWMNGHYYSRSWFDVIPADGSYSRSVQTALVYAIQEELQVAGANGNYGPGTRAAVQAKLPIAVGDTDGAGHYWVRLFQAAMRFNQYACNFDGTFASTDSILLTAFQSFCHLPVTGQGNYQSWSSLLVSNGDPDRAGQAADCITEITAARAATLVGNGRTTIGRYLSEPDGSQLNKEIQPGELDVIFDAGLRVFPIFQMSGDEPSDFSDATGYSDALAAVDAASGYGFKRNTVIYFGVDFDPNGDQITTNVVPYFKGVKRGMGRFGGKYQVGVYGTRNVCAQLAELGLAARSFVAGMSYGYSGNLGFRLPPNWAFDQIATITIGSGAGAIQIDNDIASGRDPGQNSVDQFPAGEKLDVAFPKYQEPALAAAMVAYIDSLDGDNTNIVHGGPDDCVLALQEHDALVTGLARAWGIRKAMIQAVAFWEYLKTRDQDSWSDLIVTLYYEYKVAYEEWEDNHIGMVPLPPVDIETDSSTGFAQIFAATGIWAHNWAVANGFETGSAWDASDWHDMWRVWQLLHDDVAFNLSMVPSVLMVGADEIGVANPPRLTFTSAETKQIIARYNGTGSAAESYGVKVKGVYDVFEAFNAPLRAAS